jgi:hypothetical protein
MSALIQSAFQKIADLHHAVFGKEKLFTHEEMCFSAWQESLRDSAKIKLDAQMKAVRVIQHQAAGAKVCFYYADKGDTPLFEPSGPDMHVATVSLAAGDRAAQPSLRAKIFVHQGRFFSIEFAKRPARYIEQHGMNQAELKVLDVMTVVSLE